MKNFLPILAAFLFVATTATAQLGIKAGLNRSSLYVNDKNIDDKKAKLGFQLGLVLELPISESVSIQPEAVYTRRGAKFSQAFTEVNAHYDYVDVPLLLVLKPLPFLRFHAGPQLSYLIDVEYEFNNAAGETTKDGNRDNFQTWDYGMALGTSIHFGAVYVEARYTQGFRSVNKPRELFGVQFADSDLKNYGLQASIGLFLQ